MSIETWKKEFYPITGEDAAKHGENAAIEHAIHKWNGFRSENLAKHGVSAEEVDREWLAGKLSCALCQLVADCSECPFLKKHGSICTEFSAWGNWNIRYRPEPMIIMLEALRD